MEKSESHRRDLSNAVEELMLICDTSEKELNKLVSVEQVSLSAGPISRLGGLEQEESSKQDLRDLSRCSPGHHGGEQHPEG